MSDQPQAASYKGWANIEVFGHSSHVGFVTTEYFGSACMFRVDTPELPEREYELTSPEHASGKWWAAGTKVKRPGSPAHSVLLGPSAIFRMTPMSELVAMEMIEQRYRRPLIVLEITEGMRLEKHTDEHDDESEDG